MTAHYFFRTVQILAESRSVSSLMAERRSTELCSRVPEAVFFVQVLEQLPWPSNGHDMPEGRSVPHGHGFSDVRQDGQASFLLD